MTKPKTSAATKPARWTGTKADFIRSCGTAAAPLVVIAAKRAGLRLTTKHIHNVQSANRLEDRRRHARFQKNPLRAPQPTPGYPCATRALQQELRRAAFTHGLPAIEDAAQRLRAELV